MTLAEFAATLSDAAPPDGISPPLCALWHDAKDDWNRAHEIAQEVETRDGAWTHAYLHRKEGDDVNAAYWYRRAGQPVAGGPLDSEWAQIVTALLLPLPPRAE